MTRRSLTSRWLRLSIERNDVLLVGAAVAVAVLGVSLLPEVLAGDPPHEQTVLVAESLAALAAPI